MTERTNLFYRSHRGPGPSDLGYASDLNCSVSVYTEPIDVLFRLSLVNNLSVVSHLSPKLARLIGQALVDAADEADKGTQHDTPTTESRAEGQLPAG